MAHTRLCQRRKTTMKKKLQPVEDRELEILKAVAQAWYSHSSGSRPTSEFEAHRRNFRGRLPSRFKLEAMRKSTSASNQASDYAAWDFGQSLWDAYEIVAVSKRLETGLFVDDNPFNELDSLTRVVRRRRESKHSLRSLFDKMSSRRFNKPDVPSDNDT